MSDDSNEASKDLKPPVRRKTVRPRSPSGAEPLSDEITRRIEEAVAKAVHDTGLPVPPEKEQEIAQAIAITAVQIAYQGPLPPPAVLYDFDQVVSGLGREIADSAWSEQDHRHMWEKRALWNDIFTQSGGLVLGWLLAGTCVGLYFYLIVNKYPALPSSLLLGPPLLTMIRGMLPAPQESKSAARDIGDAHPSAPESEH